LLKYLKNDHYTTSSFREGERDHMYTSFDVCSLKKKLYKVFRRQ